MTTTSCTDIFASLWYDPVNLIDDLAARVAQLEDDNNTLNIAVGALALAAASLGIIAVLCLFRVANKKQFAHSVSGLPIVHTIGVEAKSSTTADMKA